MLFSGGDLSINVVGMFGGMSECISVFHYFLHDGDGNGNEGSLVCLSNPLLYLRNVIAVGIRDWLLSKRESE